MHYPRCNRKYKLKNNPCREKFIAVNIALYVLIRFHSLMNKNIYDRKMDYTKEGILWWK